MSDSSVDTSTWPSPLAFAYLRAVDDKGVGSSFHPGASHSRSFPEPFLWAAEDLALLCSYIVLADGVRLFETEQLKESVSRLGPVSLCGEEPGEAGTAGGVTGAFVLLQHVVRLAAAYGDTSRQFCFPDLVISMAGNRSLWEDFSAAGIRASAPGRPAVETAVSLVTIIEKIMTDLDGCAAVELLSVCRGEILLQRQGPVLPVISFRGPHESAVLNPGSGRRAFETLLPSGKMLLRNVARRMVSSLFPFCIVSDSPALGPSLYLMEGLSEQDGRVRYRLFGGRSATGAAASSDLLTAASWFGRRPALAGDLTQFFQAEPALREIGPPSPTIPGGIEGNHVAEPVISASAGLEENEVFAHVPVTVVADIVNTGTGLARDVVVQLEASEAWTPWPAEHGYRFDLKPGQRCTRGFRLSANAEGSAVLPGLIVQPGLGTRNRLPSPVAIEPARVEVQVSPIESYRHLLKKVWEDTVLTGDEKRELSQERDTFKLSTLDCESVEREQKLRRLLLQVAALDTSLVEDISDNTMVLMCHDVAFGRFVFQLGRVYLYLKGGSDLVTTLPDSLELTSDALKSEFPLRLNLDQVNELAPVESIIGKCLEEARQLSGPLEKLKEILVRIMVETPLRFRLPPVEALTGLSFILPLDSSSCERLGITHLVGVGESSWSVRLAALLTSGCDELVDRLESAGFSRLQVDQMEPGEATAWRNLLGPKRSRSFASPLLDLGGVRLSSGEEPASLAILEKLVGVVGQRLEQDLSAEHTPSAKRPAGEEQAGGGGTVPYPVDEMEPHLPPVDPELTYREAVQRAWSDDILSAEELKELSRLYRRLGLPEQKALAILKTCLFRRIQADLLGVLKYASFHRKAHPSSGKTLFTGKIFDRDFIMVELSPQSLNFYVLGASPPWPPVWEGMTPVREPEPGRHWYRLPLKAIRNLEAVRTLFKKSYLIALGDVAEELLAKPETGGTLTGAVEYLRTAMDYSLSPRFVGSWSKLLAGDCRFNEEDGILVLSL